jgi:hypothetical protein
MDAPQEATWPSWLGEDVAGLAVWLVAYNAHKSLWRGWAMHWADVGPALLQRLLEIPELRTGAVALVGYSFGGVIVKSILRTAKDSTSDARAQDFFARISRVALIACPNAGSNAATLANLLRFVFRPSLATRSLRADDPALLDLNRWFQNWALPNHDRLLSLSETRKNWLLGLIVTRASANPGLGRNIAIEGDHSSIIRIASRLHMTYSSIREFLRDLPMVAEGQDSSRFALALRGNTAPVSPFGSAVQAGVPITDAAIDSAGQLSRVALLPEPVPQQSTGPTAILDLALTQELDSLRAGRFMQEFPRVQRALTLGDRILSGDLSLCSRNMRAVALAWCARILVHTEESEPGKAMLARSRTLADTIEAQIAAAFFEAADGDQPAALAALGHLNEPAARSAALFIKSRGRPPADALAWFRSVGLALEALDLEGRQQLLDLLIRAKEWEAARTLAASVRDETLTAVPLLASLAGLALLAITVPVEFREVVLAQVPFQAKTFPLAADAQAIVARRDAERLFAVAAARARELGCPRQAVQIDDVALWIRLRDPQLQDAALSELRQSIDDRAVAIRRFAMAMDFGVPVDPAAVERLVDQQETLVGRASQETASARFVLVFTKPTPKDAAIYIRKHRDQLRAALNPAAILNLEVEFLIRAGSREDASALVKAYEGDLSAVDRARLQSFIVAPEGTDPLTEARQLYEASGSLGALIQFVDRLADHGAWAGVVVYADRLFKQSNDLRAFRLLARGLEEEGLHQRLFDELRAHEQLRGQSEDLETLWAWSLFRAGDFQQATEMLARLRGRQNDANIRSLTVNLAMVTGRWADLVAHIEEEYRDRADRSADELIQAANLATAVGSNRAEALAREAVGRAPDNPNILTGAYSIASSAGWENAADVSEWLQRAVRLSGENGPVRSVSLEQLQELLAHRSDERGRPDEALAKFISGELPMFAFGQLSGRNLIEMVLFEGLANIRQVDPRARSFIPVRSGIARPPTVIPRSVAIDPTGLLVLALLGCLDKVIGALDRVIIPHKTLSWLFQERTRIGFHQPSRVREAQFLRDALATAELACLQGLAEVPDNLRRDVGNELAELLNEAIVKTSVGYRHLVVRAPPVFKPGTLMNEPANLDAFADVMVSCTQVVQTLRDKGLLTVDEEKWALSYLAIQEPASKDLHPLPETATLYLDSLSLGYLYHCRVLNKLKQAGFSAFVSAEALERHNALLAYERLGEEVAAMVEGIRTVLEREIAVGKIDVSSAFNTNSIVDVTLRHPCLDVLNMPGEFDAIVTGDRALNRFSNVQIGEQLRPIVPVVDLLVAFAENGLIPLEVVAGARAKSRAANLSLLPLTTDEIDTHLREARAHESGGLIETTELRLIRESILNVRRGQALQLPQEGAWLLSCLASLQTAIRLQWRPGIPVELARARSQWLLDLCDLRGWTHRFVAPPPGLAVDALFAERFLPLVFPLINVSAEIADHYWEWIVSILQSLERYHTKTFEALLSNARTLVVMSPDHDSGVTGGLVANNLEKKVRVLAALGLFPPMLREKMLFDDAFNAQYQLTRTTVTLGPSGPTLDCHELNNEARTALASGGSAALSDLVTAEVWSVRPDQEEPARVLLTNGDKTFILPFGFALASSAEDRMRGFLGASETQYLPRDAVGSWSEQLRLGPLTDAELSALVSDVEMTPARVHDALATFVAAERFETIKLVPASRVYFERLVGTYKNSPDILAYAENEGRCFLLDLLQKNSRNGRSLALLVSAHPIFAQVILSLLQETGATPFDFLEGMDPPDLFSRTALLEFCAHAGVGTAIIEPLLRGLREELSGTSPACTLLSHMFILTEGELARKGTLDDAPPYWRRLAAFAHASFLQRLLSADSIDLDVFVENVRHLASQTFTLRTFLDLPAEPRWIPAFIAPEQLRAELIGRSMNAAAKIIDDTRADVLKAEIEALRELVGDGMQLSVAFPGPCEGGVRPSLGLPDAVQAEIERELCSRPPVPRGFQLLFRSALFCNIDSSIADLAVNALRDMINRRIVTVEIAADSDLIPGLGHVAAVTNNKTLAAELRRLSRVARRMTPSQLSPHTELQVILLASAAHEEKHEYADFLGDWLLELALSKMPLSAARTLHSHIKVLLDLEAGLWSVIAPALAALELAEAR